MEVTKDNFLSLLPEIKKTINEASFLAIDGEFTGLSDGPRANPFDTPAQYFDKVRNGCSEFLLIQFGLCAFKYNQVQKRFTHTAYNFYIFPNPINRNVPDFRFRCQSSSLNFLASNNFDFNKLFKSGIPFLTHDAEQALMEEIQEKEKSLLDTTATFTRVNDTPIKIPDEFKENVENACDKLQALLDNGKPGDSVEIDEPNGFVRKLIYQAVEKRFSEDPIVLETKKLENRKFALVATKGQSKQELEKMKAEKGLEEMKNRLKETVGFSAIIRLISESGKLVVGHNMFLDIFYTISQFCTSLLNGYEEFKEIVHFTLPKVIDTKVMCALAPLKEKVKSSVLPHLLETVQTEPFEVQQIEMEEKGSGYSLKDEKEHEAGYDAYITGICFLALYDYLNSIKKCDALDYSSSYLANAPALKGFINKVFLMRRFDAPYLNLAGSDPILFRKNVFHVTFPKEWVTQDIINLFSAYSDVDIVWCNENSAWVSLYDRNTGTIQKVIKNLVNTNEPNAYTVRTFAQYQDFLNNLSPSGNSDRNSYLYDRKRKLTETPSSNNRLSRPSPKVPKMESSTKVYLAKSSSSNDFAKKDVDDTNKAKDSNASNEEDTSEESSDDNVAKAEDTESEEDTEEEEEEEGEEEEEEMEVKGSTGNSKVKRKADHLKGKASANSKKLFQENSAWE